MDIVDRILNGENIRTVFGVDYLIENEAEIFEMSKVSDKYAKQSITGKIPGFIYFSPVLDSHGPRIKFYGGTNQTNITRNAPTYEFGVDGPQNLKLYSWMDKDNCPNAFNPECIKQVQDFINNHLALLLLTWFNHVDESDVLQYFYGQINFKELLSNIMTSTENKEKISKCRTEKELYIVCKELDLYKF